MYLADTNLILEILLRQEKADDVKRFFDVTPHDQLFLTEFSLYSVGIVLIRRNLHDTFLRTVEDLVVNGGFVLVRLNCSEMLDVARASKRFRLDFDDAYQYVAAEKYNLTIVSFDADFDRTERGRKEPHQVTA
jgi:predicted nucleic acid-binding protein